MVFFRGIFFFWGGGGGLAARRFRRIMVYGAQDRAMADMLIELEPPLFFGSFEKAVGMLLLSSFFFFFFSISSSENRCEECADERYDCGELSVVCCSERVFMMAIGGWALIRMAEISGFEMNSKFSIVMGLFWCGQAMRCDGME